MPQRNSWCYPGSAPTASPHSARGMRWRGSGYVLIGGWRGRGFSVPAGSSRYRRSGWDRSRRSPPGLWSWSPWRGSDAAEAERAASRRDSVVGARHTARRSGTGERRSAAAGTGGGPVRETCRWSRLACRPGTSRLGGGGRATAPDLVRRGTNPVSARATACAATPYGNTETIEKGLTWWPNASPCAELGSTT